MMLNCWKRKPKKINAPDMFDKEELPSKFKMRKRINTLENELDTLKEIIKSELYKSFIDKLGEPERIKRLTEENKKLRLKIKSLKEEKNDGNSRKERN